MVEVVEKPSVAHTRVSLHSWAHKKTQAALKVVGDHAMMLPNGLWAEGWFIFGPQQWRALSSPWAICGSGSIARPWVDEHLLTCTDFAGTRHKLLLGDECWGETLTNRIVPASLGFICYHSVALYVPTDTDDVECIDFTQLCHWDTLGGLIDYRGFMARECFGIGSKERFSISFTYFCFSS